MKDIAINTSTFDILTVTDVKRKTYILSEGARALGDSAAYSYVDVEFESGEMLAALRFGFYIDVTYIPKAKTMRLRLKERSSDGTFLYARNKKNNGAWFVACLGEKDDVISPAELICVSSDVAFVKIVDEFAIIYSDPLEDFVIRDAEEQNKELLILCNPTNLYQYPTTGVGAVNWVGSIDSRALAEKVISEMAKDGMSVVEASYNSTSGDLLVQIKK